MTSSIGLRRRLYHGPWDYRAWPTRATATARYTATDGDEILNSMFLRCVVAAAKKIADCSSVGYAETGVFSCLVKAEREISAPCHVAHVFIARTLGPLRETF